MSGRRTNALRACRLVARERLERHGARVLAGEKLLAILDDVALTERLQQAGTLMGIEAVDHVILADTRCCSFKEMGRL